MSMGISHLRLTFGVVYKIYGNLSFGVTYKIHGNFTPAFVTYKTQREFHLESPIKSTGISHLRLSLSKLYGNLSFGVTYKIYGNFTPAFVTIKTLREFVIWSHL